MSFLLQRGVGACVSRVRVYRLSRSPDAPSARIVPDTIAVYPTWGWVTEDGEQALALVKRFGSVTVLNGHIHQILQKVEGQITFHTALSTAYPQPAPGAAPSPGPLQVPADQLHQVLGIRDVRYVQGQHALALVEAPLG